VEQSPLVEIGLPIALFIIMVGIGLTLTTADFRREARHPRAMIVGSVIQIIGMPLLAFGIALLLNLDPLVALGLVILAACPGGTTSNLVTLLARANVALSIVMTVVASIITIVTLPLAANLMLALQPIDVDEAIRVPLDRSIGLLVVIILVPIGIGMLLRARRPEVAARAERGVSAFGAVVLVLLIVAIAYDLREDLVDFLIQAGPATLLLNLAGMAVGLTLGAGVLSARDARTCAVELGIKNGTLGILIGVTVIGGTVGFEVAVPAAVYSLVMYVTAPALIIFGRNRALLEVDDEIKA
jgi:bile acid:Na+ symporter, BASS family